MKLNETRLIKWLSSKKTYRFTLYGIAVFVYAFINSFECVRMAFRQWVQNVRAFWTFVKSAEERISASYREPPEDQQDFIDNAQG